MSVLVLTGSDIPCARTTLRENNPVREQLCVQTTLCEHPGRKQPAPVKPTACTLQRPARTDFTNHALAPLRAEVPDLARYQETTQIV